MSSFLSRLTSPAALLYTFVVLTQLATGAYMASGLEPPTFFSFAYGLAFLWILGWWLRTDCRERGIGWVFDMGLFLYIAWPLVIPYHLFKSRGSKGLLVILSFVGAYVGAGLAGMVLYLFLAPVDWPTLYKSEQALEQIGISAGLTSRRIESDGSSIPLKQPFSLITGRCLTWTL